MAVVKSVVVRMRHKMIIPFLHPDQNRNTPSRLRGSTSVQMYILVNILPDTLPE